jgi:hypothetical protein
MPLKEALYFDDIKNIFKARVFGAAGSEKLPIHGEPKGTGTYVSNVCNVTNPQDINKKVKEGYDSVIKDALKNGVDDLNTIRVPISLHINGHFSLGVVEIKLDKKFYQDLKNEYDKIDKNNNISPEEKDKQKNELLTERLNQITANSIQAKHYDSNSPGDKNAEHYKEFKKGFNGTVEAKNCPKQIGPVCGDHVAKNAFDVAVQDKEPEIIGENERVNYSEQLRSFTDGEEVAIYKLGEEIENEESMIAHIIKNLNGIDDISFDNSSHKHEVEKDWKKDLADARIRLEAAKQKLDHLKNKVDQPNQPQAQPQAQPQPAPQSQPQPEQNRAPKVNIIERFSELEFLLKNSGGENIRKVDAAKRINYDLPYKGQGDNKPSVPMEVKINKTGGYKVGPTQEAWGKLSADEKKAVHEAMADQIIKMAEAHKAKHPGMPYNIKTNSSELQEMINEKSKEKGLKIGVELEANTPQPPKQNLAEQLENLLTEPKQPAEQPNEGNTNQWTPAKAQVEERQRAQSKNHQSDPVNTDNKKIEPEIKKVRRNK